MSKLNNFEKEIYPKLIKDYPKNIVDVNKKEIENFYNETCKTFGIQIDYNTFKSQFEESLLFKQKFNIHYTCFLPKILVDNFFRFIQPDDGNCLFNSLGMFIVINHIELKKQILKYIEENKKKLDNPLFYDTQKFKNIDEYIKSIKNYGFGSTMEMYSFIQIYKYNIIVIILSGDTYLEQNIGQMHDIENYNNMHNIYIYNCSKDKNNISNHFELLIPKQNFIEIIFRKKYDEKIQQLNNKLKDELKVEKEKYTSHILQFFNLGNKPTENKYLKYKQKYILLKKQLANK